MYTDDELLDALRNFAEELGRTPTLVDLNSRDDLPSDATYYNRFGSYTTACEQAGLEPNPDHSSRSYGYDEDEIVAAVRDFAADHGRVPMKSEFGGDSGLPSWRPVYQHFGGLRQLFAAAIDQPPETRDHGADPDTLQALVDELAAGEAYRNARLTTLEMFAALAADGLTRAEMMDYYAVRVCGLDAEEWAEKLCLRGSDPRAVRRHVRIADQKLGTDD